MVLPKRNCIAVKPCYGTNAFDCGTISYFSNIKWDNARRKMSFPWEHSAAIWDIDGSFLEGGKLKVSETKILRAFSSEPLLGLKVQCL